MPCPFGNHQQRGLTLNTTVNAKGKKRLFTRGTSISFLGILLFLGACSSVLKTPVPELATQAAGCLSGGKVTKLSGTYNQTVLARNQSNPKIDASNAKLMARAGKFSFIGARNKGSLCLSGGVYDVGLSLSAAWSAYHGQNGIYFTDTPNITVENIAVVNAGDGVSFKNNTPNWTLRSSYIKHAGDDAVENDRGNSGRVTDVLVDGAFMGFSCRKEGSNALKSNSFTIDNSLIAMDAKRSAYMFKWTFRTKDPGCKLTLKNNVFLLPKSAGYMDPGDHPQVYSRPLNEGACKGNKNTIVYTGGNKSYLEQLKKASPACFDVTTDKNVWIKARNAWFSRNSQFSRYR